jgi:hypothetical protein
LIIPEDGHGIDRGNGGQTDRPIRLGVGLPGTSARKQQLGGKLDHSLEAEGASPCMPPCPSAERRQPGLCERQPLARQP